MERDEHHRERARRARADGRDACRTKEPGPHAEDVIRGLGASARTADASGSRPLKVAVAHGRRRLLFCYSTTDAWLRTDETEAWARDVYRLAVEKGLTRVVEALYEARARVLKTDGGTP